MGLVYNNVILNGLVFNNKSYLKSGASSYIENIVDIELTKNITPSAGSDYTAGYPITFSFITESFELYKYNDIVNKLTYLPSYKFVLNNVTKQDISGISLIYNGDGTFSITGSLNISPAYSSSKIVTIAPISISLVDENGNIFVSNKKVLSQTVSSTSTSVSFTSSTLTLESYHLTNIGLKSTLTVPGVVPDDVVETKYITDSGLSSSFVITQKERKIY